ncbi:exodeoxyribonuclease V subunit gamma [Pseudonocardia sp. HH130630-07]|uniref:exodeoxyribonuclease V subunit gamma n=1 Tax=Pseudonocardia sp. HH130630-07 TaxID=1690815 RepID=UPI000814D668|nr:exodeoxyribonuclease V subunit gamma [Pseudonocardia sp. HH130630-07]ANY04991.1 exodeoxyribonuclease V subunit gamma [Pseudonocardia sp. HH130630-07]
MLELHRAERADTLVEALAGVLAEGSGDPFAAEVVAVPERGVERWLAQRLAHRLGADTGSGGVCANIRFPPPAQLLGEVVAHVTGVDAETDPWAPGRAVWPLLELVDSAVRSGDDRFTGLAAHLDRGGHGRRYALARSLAGLFSLYATHRPALLHDWLTGVDAVPADLTWQPELWRRLRGVLGEPGPAERLGTAVAALRDGASPGPGVPDRVSLFGPTRLAAEHLTVLGALAGHRDVHLWLPHPSPAMWRAVRAARPEHPPARAADTSARRVGNPLLRSLGRDVRELTLRLPAAGDPGAPRVVDTHHPAPAADRAPTVLRLLQDALRDDAAPPAPGDRPLLDPGDRSVVLHSCHGPDRQVEVLREVLLGLLAADGSLEPRDIVVLCPDIEVFAPLITASFGLAPEAGTDGADGSGPSRAELHPGHLLRVRLADRALRQANPLLGTVSTLLELAGSRVTASQVLDLVATGPVRRRFRLDDDALERLTELVTAAGVRWGLDAAHRAPYRLDGIGQNTWSAGLDRLLVGVAMAEAPGAPAWLGTALPLDEVDSSDVDLVGRLAEIVDRLGTVLGALHGPQPLTAWVAALVEGLHALTDTTPSEAWQTTQARSELADVLHTAGPQAGTVELDLPDVRGLLAERLRGRPSRANFRTGTLTVATLVPMRAVPHRVVCLLGCDDGVFPRAGAPDGDDVLARDPVVGERDPRGEDRQLLLDAIGSAADHLVVVSSGADERTGARRPPAVPIGELCDAVDALVQAPGGGRASVALRARHPLQPHDRRNFTGGALLATGPFSFDRAALRGAEAAAGPPVAVPLFPAGPLAAPAEEDVVELDDLVGFVEHPVRAFLRQRVRVLPPGENAEPDDALPVELDGLATWRIGDRLLTDRLAGAPPQAVARAETLRGDLPPGGIGRRVLTDVGGRVEPLVALAGTVRTGEAASQDLVAALTGTPLDGVAVAGTVPGLHGDTVVRVEYSRLKAKHRLRAWVQLLALTAAHPGRSWTAVTIGRGTGGVARSCLGPVEPDRARAVLADLVALRRAGLREPLPLPTDAAAVYARNRARGVVPANALAAADSEWSRFEHADTAHVYVRGEGAPLLLRDEPGTGAEPTRFGELAARLWAPLLDHERQDAP